MFISLLNYLVFAVVGINVFVSLGIFLRNTKAQANRLYFMAVTFLNLWILANFLENEPELVGYGNLELFLRLDFVLAYFLVFFWALFCFNFSGTWPKLIRIFAVILGSLGIILSGFSFSGGFLIDNIAFDGDVIHFDDGVLWPFYAVALIVMLLAGLSSLFRGRKDSSPLHKNQIDLVIWGFALSLGIGMAVNFAQALVPISLEVSRIGLYGMTFLVFFTGYAVIQKQLFELKPLIVRSVIFLLLVLSLSISYSFIISFSLSYIFDVEVPDDILVFSVFVVAFAMLTFPFIKRGTELLTNSIFFKGDYNTDALLAQLTKIMAESIELTDLTENLILALAPKIKIDRAAFLVAGDNGKLSVIGTQEYLDLFAGDEPSISLMRENLSGKEYLYFDDLKESPLKDMFRSREVAFAMQLKVESGEVAIMVLGNKLSGECYRSKDINLLRLFGVQAGIAIQNAKSYERIKNFSKELEEKVKERTAELEESQKKELAKAQEVARLKDEFVFLAAHELRTPIAAISGFMELVSESMARFPKDVRQHLMSISNASVHLNQLISDLLQVARSESATLTVATSRIEVGQVIEAVIRELEPMLDKKKITLEIRMPDRSASAMADEPKLKEVLSNIVGNAIKYNRDGGHIEISVYALNGRVMIEVEDSGFGIPEEDKSKIFTKFFRSRTKETEDIMGTGLGLFIVKMLVERMAGEIKFTSVEGKGSTFAITLPEAS